ncbi:MAG: RMD1 family protein [Gammaproteobacteria bacterium]|nr:RMD1 family protein [Gammaproteobacteria bacterium]
MSALVEAPEFKARAILLGERLDLRSWRSADAVATNPLVVRVRGGGAAALYRHGVVVFFGVHAAEEVNFLSQLGPCVTNAYSEPEVEEIDVHVDGTERESLTGGDVVLADAGVERLQVLADVLSKSVLLSLYEQKVASDFDRIEPLAAQLGRSGRIPRHSKELLKMIGSMVLVEHRMVGRAAIAEKPEILWENPTLETLFVKLEDEYEITTRHAALERKLNLIAQTANTVMELLSSKHSLRVEWYIVILILVDIVLSLYEKLVGPI